MIFANFLEFLIINLVMNFYMPAIEVFNLFDSIIIIIFIFIFIDL